MKNLISATAAIAAALAFNLSLAPTQVALAQEAEVLEEVVVTGSRIRRNPLNEGAAIMELGNQQLVDSGQTNLGDALQQLPISGSAINSNFNTPGNSGFPQDGSGIGAGAVQLSVRNLGSKRTLILVDGKRWVAGASASGVPSVVDLNTIPDNVIERIEVLQDGASAIYGSDAIGGVVNIITKQDFQGFRMDAQAGSYLSHNDGESNEISALWGAGNDTTHLVLSASYADEGGVETADRKQSAFPNPGETSCDVPGSLCSSGTPQGRFLFGPAFNFWDGTLNDGVLNDGGANIPVFDPNNVNGGDFHQFTGADRFNYSGPGFNFLKTPVERVNIYANVRHKLHDQVTLVARASYTNRSSETKGAPEPLFFGPGSGTPILDNMFISANNPYNPFGVDLSAADDTLLFFARRPIEAGPRLFFQDINTYMISLGLEGEFEAAGRNFYWDLTANYGDNRGFQEKFNGFNAAKLQVALGDPAVCAATPNCVPFNFFGGQGPDGTGSMTQDMLDFVTYTQRDFSEQTLEDYAFNIAGNIASLPAGDMGFAAGIEFRDHQGSFRPDSVAARGETAGIPSGPTSGGFDVTEYYAEVSIPLLSDAAAADWLEVNLAARNSDYSTSGSTATYKFGALWRPIENLSLRGSTSTGIRAPGIGEYFGGAARQDFLFFDPCVDYTASLGSAAGGRDTAQPASIQTNCATLGVGPGLAQTNPQFSAVSAGNNNLVPEESDAWTIGLVYSPQWAEGITFSLDYYEVEITDAIQGRLPADLVNACVETTDPFFCDNVPRTANGTISLVNNPLDNIGGIDAAGLDLMFNYVSDETSIGQFNLTVNATHLNEYVERIFNADGTVIVNDLTGKHTTDTFEQAYPEWRAVTSLDWSRERWSGGLTLRWVDDMVITNGFDLDSVLYTDVRASYNPSFAGDALTVTVGVNNVLDEDPPLCLTSCGFIGMSKVAHDLPGRFGYLRVSYRP